MLGEEQAWEELARCDPAEVCERAAAAYSPDQGYVVPVFGLPVVLDMKARTMTASSPESEFVLTKTAYFSRLSILFYLLRAQKIAPTGRLLKPSELKSRQIYLQGSHLLPLEPIAARFSADPGAFLAQAARFGGSPGITATPLRNYCHSCAYPSCSSSGWRMKSSRQEATCSSTRSASSSCPPTSCGRSL